MAAKDLFGVDARGMSWGGVGVTIIWAVPPRPPGTMEGPTQCGPFGG